MYSSCFSPLFSSSEKKTPTNNTEHLVVTISSHRMVIFEKCIHLFDKKKTNTMAWGRSCFERNNTVCGSVDVGILIVRLALLSHCQSHQPLLMPCCEKKVFRSRNMDRKIKISIILIPILVSPVPVLVSRIQFRYRYYIVHTDDFIETTGLSITWTKTHSCFF